MVKAILFVCVENSCRSQIAEGLMNYYGRDIIKAYSAGSKPSGKVNPDAIQVMKEIDIDISSNHSKGFDELPLKEFDYVISMGCKDVCPYLPAKKHIEWNIPDPKGKDLDYFREIRDNIKEKIVNLLKEI